MKTICSWELEKANQLWDLPQSFWYKRGELFSRGYNICGRCGLLTELSESSWYVDLIYSEMTEDGKNNVICHSCEDEYFGMFHLFNNVRDFMNSKPAWLIKWEVENGSS